MDDVNTGKLFWEKRLQESVKGEPKFEEDRLQLNLQKNANGVYECSGGIQGIYPIYVPDEHSLARNIIEDAHRLSLHGGVILTIAKDRQHYWIPRLRR